MNKRALKIFFGLLTTFALIIIFNNQATLIALISPNPLLIASKVRDRDELRLAEANFQIGQWRLKNQLPLNVNSLFDFKGIRSFLIIVITSNRGRREIDKFEPYYITQTSVALLKELISTNENISTNVGMVKFFICAIDQPNGTDAYSKELKRLRRILGNGIIASPPRNSGDQCKYTLDMTSCLSLGMKLYPEGDNIVLLEDDFLVTKHFLSVLNMYANLPGYNIVKLYTNSRSALQMTVYLYTPLFLLSLFMSVVSFCALKQKWFRYVTAIVAVTSFILLINACNRPESPVIFPTKEDEFTALGAAAILPKFLARNVSESSPENICHWRKGEYISKVASALAYNILGVHPPAAIHIGMYSQTHGLIYNPNLFPH
ncbi:hypothetical protein Aperf_G00000074583 [Anoplocephala perfoliata]